MEAKVHQFRLERGCEIIYDIIVASGGNTSPYRRWATDKLIRQGDLVIVDINAVGPSGYFIDFVRCFKCGGPQGMKMTPKEIDLYRGGYDTSRNPSASSSFPLDPPTLSRTEKHTPPPPSPQPLPCPLFFLSDTPPTELSFFPHRVSLPICRHHRGGAVVLFNRLGALIKVGRSKGKKNAPEGSRPVWGGLKYRPTSCGFFFFPCGPPHLK